MRSRALNLAALALLAGLCGSIGVAVQPVVAQQLDAGKPPAQIFAGTCAACHRSPRGLVRSVAPGSLPSFLRQHYTTGNDMAGTMASFVLGNGGTQQVAEPPAKQEPKQRAKSDGPDVAARTPAVEPRRNRRRRNSRRPARRASRSRRPRRLHTSLRRQSRRRRPHLPSRPSRRPLRPTARSRPRNQRMKARRQNSPQPC
jgi:hypothetical protein